MKLRDIPGMADLAAPKRVTRKQHEEAVAALRAYCQRVVDEAVLKTLTTDPPERLVPRPPGPTSWEAIPPGASVCQSHRCYWESPVHTPDETCRRVTR